MQALGLGAAQEKVRKSLVQKYYCNELQRFVLIRDGAPDNVEVAALAGLLSWQDPALVSRIAGRGGLRPAESHAAHPMAIAPRPDPNDIVVREDRAAGMRIYVLHRYSGADQVFVHSRAEAIARALRAARQQHVAAWISENGDGPVPLDVPSSDGRDDSPAIIDE